METIAAPHNTKQAKTILTIIIALAYALTIPFWVAVQAFHLQGLPLYFTQLGLYASFFLLAWWGILLTGLVHGLMDYPLIGKDTQLSFLILLAAIGCVELVRLAARSKPAPDGAPAEAR